MAVLWSNQLRWYVGAYDLSTATTRSSVMLHSPALDKTVYVDASESSSPDVRRDEVEWAGLFEDGTRGLDALIGTLIGTRGDMLSYVVGTATGARAYCGTVGIMAIKPGARLGELVRVEGTFKPDGLFDPTRHFGPSQVVTTAGTSGTIGDGAASTGTHRLFVHVFRLGGAGTFIVNLQDAATAVYADVAGATASFTAIGSTAIQFTGTLRANTKLNWTFNAGSGSTDFFGAYRRSG